MARALGDRGPVRPPTGLIDDGANSSKEVGNERAVLAATDRGATIPDIARTLLLSEGTVRNHLSAAIQKIGARNRGEAARIAGQKGWL